MSDPTAADAGPADEPAIDPAAPYGTVEVAPGVVMRAAPTRKRGRETARDMVLSMAVILVPVLILVFVVARQPSPDPVRLVDWKPVAARAAAQASFPVMAPTGGPATWRATSARFEAVPAQSDARLWHLGLITPGERYAGIEQSDADAGSFTRDVLDKAVAAGPVQLGGQTWQRWTAAANGYRSLVRPVGGSTLVVTGSADWPELEALAASLAPVPNVGPARSGPASPVASG